MKKIIAILLVCFAISGCATTMARSNLNKLEKGMTKKEVSEIMGKPYKREVYPNLEYWFYLTENPQIYAKPVWSDLTPIRFRNGVVEGWGASYWELRKTSIGADINIKNE